MATARIRTVGWLTLCLATAALAGGCSGGGTPSAGPSTHDTPSTQPATTPPGTSPGSTASPPSGTPTTSPDAPPTPPCHTSDLTITVQGGEPAAGTVYSHLVMTNTSSHACSTGAWPGVSYVGHGNGTQIGAAAKRVSGDQVRPLVLQPGDRAVAILGEADAHNYPPGRCGPTPADGLRVYPPNETASAYVRHPTLACAKPGAPLLTIAPFHAGR